VTIGTVCTTQGCESDKLIEQWEFMLDNGLQKNLMHIHFLTDTEKSDGTGGLRTISGESEITTETGYLQVFFKCDVCNTCQYLILSQADIEVI